MNAIDEQVKTFLRQGLIRPSRSEWGSNVVLVKKSDGNLRFCVDYRQLNLATIMDCYPLPRIDACLDALGGARWFSTFDPKSRYHLVAMDPRNADKTTFITQNGTWCFQAMPFGSAARQPRSRD